MTLLAFNLEAWKTIIFKRGLDGLSLRRSARRPKIGRRQSREEAQLATTCYNLRQLAKTLLQLATTCHNLLQLATTGYNLLHHATTCHNMPPYATLCYNRILPATTCHKMLHHATTCYQLPAPLRSAPTYHVKTSAIFSA